MGVHYVLCTSICLLVAWDSSVGRHLADRGRQVGLAVPDDQFSSDGFKQA
jgi:hypothetical protein